jgi:hypothetical protein
MFIFTRSSQFDKKTAFLCDSVLYSASSITLAYLIRLIADHSGRVV